jgi:hypothetical protein
MYLVHVNHGSSTVAIHLVGGCRAQGKSSTGSADGLDEWSYQISSLREARDYASLARKQRTLLCPQCEQHDAFGA